MRPYLPSILTLAGALAIGACAPEPAEELDEVAATTPAASTYAYSTWDTDADQRLTQEEFTGVTRDRVYNTWNTTADAGLDQNEIGTGLYGLWDADDNNQLTEAEWNAGTQRWNRAGINYGEWSAWDANNDGWLDMNEYNQGLAATNFYDTWDTDRNNLIDDTEFGGGVFDTWDTNDDMYVDNNEWDLGAGGVDWF